MDAGVYAFYVRSDPDGSNKQLCYALYDGEHLSGPVTCVLSTPAPDMVAAPCAVWESQGQYTGDGRSRLHVFLPVGGGQVWWLTSIDGQNFSVNPIVSPSGGAYLRTSYRIAAYLYPTSLESPVWQQDPISWFNLYFNSDDSEDQSLFHVASHGGQNFEAVHPIEVDGIPSKMLSGAAVCMRGGAPNLAFKDQSSGKTRLLYLHEVSTQYSAGYGNGQWSDISPEGSWTGLSPSLALLGDDLFLTHQGWHQDPPQGPSVDPQLYFTSNSVTSGWVSDAGVPNATSTNGPGTCVWGGRLYCFFQSSSGNTLFVQVYVNGAWLPGPKQVPGITGVWFGISAVAVHPLSP